MEIAIVVLRSGDRVLARLRTGDPLLAGKIEFPGGRVESGESPRDAAAREFCEETGVPSPPLDPLHVEEHDYPDRKLRLHFFIARTEREFPTSRGAWSWMEFEKLDCARIPPANQAVVQLLRPDSAHSVRKSTG